MLRWCPRPGAPSKQRGDAGARSACPWALAPATVGGRTGERKPCLRYWWVIGLIIATAGVLLLAVVATAEQPISDGIWISGILMIAMGLIGPLLPFALPTNANGTAQPGGNRFVEDGTIAAPLPGDVPLFGRDAETRWLVDSLKDRRGVALCARGLGGVGKTALAKHAGHELREHFPDGIAWVAMHGARGPALTAADAMRHVIRFLDPTAQLPSDESALADAYQQALGGRRLLIVLDDAPDDPAAVRPLQPPAGNGLLVTSRFNIAFPGLAQRNLDVLDDASAREMLRQRSGRDLDDATADAIVQRCGHLPLAVEVAGTQLAADETLSPKTYLDRLADAATRWDALAIAGLDDANVKGVLGLSLEQLRKQVPDAADRWLALGVFPQDFDLRAAAAVWDCADDEARSTLGTLAHHALVQMDGDRYRLHDLLRDLARHRANDLTDARRRHAVHFRDVLRKAERMHDAGHERVLEGLALFDGERANIEAGQQWAADNAGTDARAQGLCAKYPLAGADVLAMRLPVATQRDWDETGRAAARAAGDGARERRLAGNLGIRYRELGEPQRAIACHERSRDLAREAGDRQGEANALGMLGHAYQETGRPDAARRAYKDALAIDREIGYRRGEAMMLDGLGILARQEGDPAAALDWFGQALDVSREVGDRRGEGTTLHNMGVAHADLEQWAEARDCLHQALAIREDLSDPETEETRAALAEVERLSGGG